MGVMEFVGTVLCACAGGGVAWTLGRRLGVLHPLVVGMLVHAAVAVGIYMVAGLWAPDAVKYDHMGRELAAFWRGGAEPVAQIGDGKEGFPAVLGVLYFVFGAHPALGLAINWVAHALLTVTVAATAKRASLPVVPSAWIIALFPPALLWGGLLLREALTWLLLAGIAYSLVAYATSRQPRQYGLYAAVFAGSMGSLIWIRGTAAVIVGIAGLAVLVVTSRKADLLARVSLAVLFVALLAPRFGELVDGYLPGEGLSSSSSTSSSSIGIEVGAGVPGRDENDGTSAEGNEPSAESDRLADIRGSLALGSTTSFSPQGSAGESTLLTNAARVALGPFPWEWQRVGMPFALDALLWLGVLGAVALGTWRSRDRFRVMALMLVPAALLLGALVVTSGNYGTMQRLRVQSAILIAPVAAAGLLRRPQSGPAATSEDQTDLMVL